MFNYSHRTKKGFTLIELMVVISIISLLSSVVMASLNSSRNKARVSAGMQYSSYLKRTMATVFELNFNNNISLDSSGKQGVIEGTITPNADSYNNSLSGSFPAGAAITWPSKTDSDFDFTNKSFAVSLWIKTNGSNLNSNHYNSARLIWTGHCNIGQKGYTIALSKPSVNPGGRIETGIIGEGGVGFYFYTTENLNILDNKWHNISVVFDFNNKKSAIFLDGKKISGIVNGNIGGACSTVSNGYIDFSQCNLNYVPQNDATNLYIGKSPDGLCGTQTYSGLLDDVTILKEI